MPLPLMAVPHLVPQAARVNVGSDVDVTGRFKPLRTSQRLIRAPLRQRLHHAGYDHHLGAVDGVGGAGGQEKGESRKKEPHGCSSSLRRETLSSEPTNPVPA